MFLRDLQLEIPSLVSRWLLNDPPGSLVVVDDVGGLELTTIGAPVLGARSICDGDPYTCAAGGVGGGTSNGFKAAVSDLGLEGGITIEAAVTPGEAGNGGSINVNILSTWQTTLQVNQQGLSFVFMDSTLTQHVVTAHSVLTGWPQLVHGVYDPAAQTQTIYVDGVAVASAAASGEVITTLSGNAAVLGSLTTSGTVNVTAQDVAVYRAPLSQNRITRHFQAFAQVWPDPGHARVYEKIGVTQ